MTESIGTRLRRALATAGLNQSDLVRLSGIDKNTISALVNDKSQPRPGTLTRVEEALGLTPGTLAGLGEDSAPPRPAPLEGQSAGGRFTLVLQEGDDVGGHAEATITYEAPTEIDFQVMGQTLARLTAAVERSVRLIGWAGAKNAESDEGKDGRVREMRKRGYVPIREAEHSQQPPNVTPNVNQDDVGLAARNAKSRGKQLRAEMDAAGEESQDNGMDPA